MNEQTRTEEFKVDGEKIVAKIKELLHEGNIRRVIIKDKDGKSLLEIPVTFGVVGVLLAPQLAALAAVAAVLTEATVVVEKTE
ncbi:MAG: DUF4342 domain-containing protein [Anaerolineae bacterium]|jgi:hypothetical protein|nr:DUF4342 domain-containing protein [Anaerolineae bacterium]